MQISTCFIFLVLFSKLTTVSSEKTTFRKSCYSWERATCIDIDDTGNLQDSPRLVFIDEERGNPILVYLPKEKAKRFKIAYRCPWCDNCCRWECFFNTMWIIANQLRKHDFSCGSVVNNLNNRKLFFDQMNKNCFNLILIGRDWNCSPL